jgi:hypothetical protein
MTDTFDGFPISRDFNTIQDADWSRTFTYTIGGSPVNLTGYSAEFVIFDDHENKLVSATSPSGVVLGGAAGTITPKITNGQTDAITAGSYRYVLWIIDGSGERTPFSAGRFNIARGVSA